jgi:hypothetical protein
MMINGTGAQRVPYNSPLEQQGRWLHRSGGGCRSAGAASPCGKGISRLQRCQTTHAASWQPITTKHCYLSNALNQISPAPRRAREEGSGTGSTVQTKKAGAGARPGSSISLTVIRERRLI